MAIKIEIISRSRQTVSAAFYFPIAVDDQIAAANDQTREPVGSALSAQEVQELKDGALHEVVSAVRVLGKFRAQVSAILEQRWTDGQVKALRDYTSRYQDVGLSWDGSAWS